VATQTFDFDQRVVVRDTSRSRENGTAGWHGRVVGKSYENDDPNGRVLAFAVAMDEDDHTVWMVEPVDLRLAELGA
jgi:hypothetical protein